MKIILFILITLQVFIDSIFVLTATDVSPCGDWEQYKDEHCYKLFDGLRSFEGAKEVCQTNNSTMTAIHYAEEQNFLNNYIFSKMKTVDNVWIGAKYAGNKIYQWEADHSSLSQGGAFSNWMTGSPKNLSDYCVQMMADVSLVGKWADEPCSKMNRVVCQRTPVLSLKLLAETMVVLKHSLQEVTKQLATSKAETDKEIAQLKKESIPIGFIYVQMPKDKSPSELWPSLTWKEISSDYEGVFFRVAGGDAAQFGEVQQGNAPRLETIYTSDASNVLKGPRHEVNHNLTLPVTGWSDPIATGATYSSNFYYTSFKHTNISEVRPKNMAIKMYRRTA